jgi:alkylhydroperoxidase/carboxymuconolactone decarboxylase family protein YurZ
MDECMKQLIAVGASVAANCQPCLAHYISKTLELVIDMNAITQAVEVAKGIRKGSADNMDKYALNIIQKRFSMTSMETESCNCCS